MQYAIIYRYSIDIQCAISICKNSDTLKVSIFLESYANQVDLRHIISC